jgi:branched-chain amino acid transport system substrate-binding protein
MIPADFGLELFQWVKEHYGLKTAATVSRMSESGVDTGANAAKFAKMAGFDVIKSEMYETGTTDFFPLVSRLLSSKAEVVVAGELAPRDGALILNQREELGGKFLYIDWAANPGPFIKIAPKACEKDFVFRYTDFSTIPKAKAFEERYKKRWKGESPTPFTQEAYDFVGVYAQAVQKAGMTDSDAVKAVLEDPTFEYEGLFGTYKWGGKSIYGSNCEMYYPIGVSVIREGKVKQLALIPVEPK